MLFSLWVDSKLARHSRRPPPPSSSGSPPRVIHNMQDWDPVPFQRQVMRCPAPLHPPSVPIRRPADIHSLWSHLCSQTTRAHMGKWLLRCCALVEPGTLPPAPPMRLSLTRLSLPSKAPRDQDSAAARRPFGRRCSPSAGRRCSPASSCVLRPPAALCCCPDAVFGEGKHHQVAGVGCIGTELPAARSKRSAARGGIRERSTAGGGIRSGARAVAWIW